MPWQHIYTGKGKLQAAVHKLTDQTQHLLTFARSNVAKKS